MLFKALNTAKTSRQAHVLDGKVWSPDHGLDVLLRPRMNCIDAIVIVQGTSSTVKGRHGGCAFVGQTEEEADMLAVYVRRTNT